LPVARAEHRVRGFTLIEILVALAVSGLVVLSARALMEAVDDAATRIGVRAESSDRTANAERLLRAVVGRLEVGTPASGQFGGDERSAQFTSWCERPGGWLERCAVTLVLRPERGGTAVALELSTGETITVARGSGRAELRYLSDARGGGSWIRVWGSGITAPLAIAVFLERDTLLLRIGERG
jgi:prepilin-type N-terminal cleavage/methylation domain-containing protein